MPTIIVCDEHQRQGYQPTIEGTPLPFDLVGALSADLTIEVPQPGGVPRTHLDCKSGCRWASDPTPGQIEEYPELAPAVEKALGSVGDPKELLVPRDSPLGKVWDNLEDAKAYDVDWPRLLAAEQILPKKEKKVAKDTAPKKRERRRGTIITRKFSESVTATLSVSGVLTDYLMLGDEAQDDLASLVEKMGTPSGIKAETSKGA